MNRSALALVSLLTLGGGLACASAAGSNASGSNAKVNENLIANAEFSGQNFRNAYEVVQRLRPSWLTKKENAPTRMGMTVSGRTGVQGDMGSGLVVFLDNTRMGGPDALRDITSDGIGSLEYMDASMATAKLPGLGSSSVTGAIVVHSRTGN